MSESVTSSSTPAETSAPASPPMVETDIGTTIHRNTPRPSQRTAPKPKIEFDPAIHVTNDDGSPKFNKDGSFKKRPFPLNGGGTKQASQQAQAEIFNAEPPPNAVQMVNMALGMATMLAVRTLGPEFQLSKDEAQILTDTWARFIHYKGWDLNASPELAVAVATIGILMPRVMSPAFLHRIFGKKNHAQPDHRTNGDGKNDAGQSTGGPVVSGGTPSSGLRPDFGQMGG